MRSLERVNIRTHIRTGQTLYPLHNFVVRGDKKIVSSAAILLGTLRVNDGSI